MKNIVVLSGTIAAGNVIFLGLAVYPLFNRIAADSDSLILYKQELEQVDVDRAGVQQFERQKKKYVQDITRFDSIFVDAITPISFLEFVEQLAKEFEFDFQITPGIPKKVEEDVWKSLNFTVDVEGPGEDVMLFVEKMEFSPFLLEVISLHIIQAQERNEQERDSGRLDGAVEAAIVVKLYTNETED